MCLLQKISLPKNQCLSTYLCLLEAETTSDISVEERVRINLLLSPPISPLGCYPPSHTQKRRAARRTIVSLLFKRNNQVN